MAVFVKICGLCSASDVDAVARLGPDALGFVFWPSSKRAVNPADVAGWCRTLPRSILKVGVFVNAPVDEIIRTTETAGLDVIQLHGDEGPEVAARIPVRVWKVIYPGKTDTRRMGAYHVDAFLVDSYSDSLPGGTGKTADWAAAEVFTNSAKAPVILAGGLTPDNVAEAIRRVRPWGVDVSSGVEARPRHKDLEKTRLFIERSRGV